MGPTAIPKTYCEVGARDREAPAWRVSGGFGWLSSELELDGIELPFWHRTTSIFLARSVGGGITVQAGVGAIVDGAIGPAGRRERLEPGVALSASATWLALDGRGALPVVAATLGLAHARAGTARASRDFQASDLSLGTSVAWPVAGRLAPYVGAKVFGGPVSWELDGEEVSGSDTRRYQVAFGLAAVLPRGADLLVEWAPLGAESALASVGWAF